MRFKIQGHENILSTHKTTLEFTKDDYLTKKGDCILGINAGFKSPRLKKKVKVKVTISSGKYKDSLVAYYNPEFKSKKEMVIRKSNFIDSRTFAVKANKAAKDISRGLVRQLKLGKDAVVDIEKAKIKAIIFDFDNTLEEWTNAQKETERRIAMDISAKYRINAKKFLEAFRKAKYYYLSKHRNVNDYDRHTWIKKALSDFSVRPGKKDIDYFAGKYWNYADHFVRLFPGAYETLSILKKRKFKLALLTDSDGKFSIKQRRVRLLKIEKFFDAIVTGDKLNLLKPDKRLFLLALKKLGVNAEECIMVGDHPEFDLLPAKELGFTTVLMKKGHWAKHKSYEDFIVEDIREVISITEELR